MKDAASWGKQEFFFIKHSYCPPPNCPSSLHLLKDNVAKADNYKG